MLDIIKLRSAYNIIHQMSENKNPLAEGEMTLEMLQSEQVQVALADAAEAIAAYGKIMNIMTQSTDFTVAPKETKPSFSATQEDIAKLEPSADAPNITTMVNYINNELIKSKNSNMSKLTTIGLGKWLMSVGYLALPDGGRNKIATEQGVALGIRTEKRIRQSDGEIYYVNYYSSEAQQFVFDSLPAVAEFLQAEKERKRNEANENGENNA